MLVVDADRGASGERGSEQPFLGGKVRVERAVIVEVVVREVRETRDGEARSVDAVLVERV